MCIKMCYNNSKWIVVQVWLSWGSLVIVFLKYEVVAIVVVIVVEL